LIQNVASKNIIIYIFIFSKNISIIMPQFVAVQRNVKFLLQFPA